MRKPLTCLPLLLLILSTVQAQSQEDRGRQYQSIAFNYGNFTVGYRIFEADLANTPAWQPEREDPPVALHQALDIARNNLRRLIKESDKLVLGKVALHRFEADKWVYEVLFNCGGSENCATAFWMFVKMDGSIFEPEFVPVDTPRK